MANCISSANKSVDAQSRTPLHRAASKGDVSAVKLLLEESCPINAQDEQGRTAAIWASLKGSVTTLQVLIDFGADLALTDIRGWNALRWAVAAHHVPVMKLLQVELKKRVEQSATAGASFHQIQLLDNASRLPDNARPVEWAAELNDEQIFDQVLFAYGSESSYWDYMWSRGKLDRPVVNVWGLADKPECGFGIRILDPSPWNEHSDSSPSLNQTHEPDHASDTFENDREGLELKKDQWRSALLATAIRDEKLLIVKLLLKTGARPDDRIQSWYGRSLLHVAALRRDPSYVRELTRLGASVGKKDVYGQTPLMQAVISGFPETVQALVEAGSDVNAIRRCSSDFRTPGRAKNYQAEHEKGSSMTVFMLACGYTRKTEDQHADQARILDILISHGADLSMRDSQERTSLHYAALCGQIVLARSALSTGININDADRNGSTALHIAIARSGINVIKFLVANGADVAIRDKFGRYAIHYLGTRKFHNDTPETALAVYQILHPVIDPEILICEYDANGVRGGQINVKMDSHTLLSVAIEGKHWALAKVLLDHNAALPTQDSGMRSSSSIFSAAVGGCQVEIVHLLASKGMEEYVQIGDDKLYYGIATDMTRLLSGLRESWTVQNIDEMLKEITFQGLDFNAAGFASFPTTAAQFSNDRALPGILHRNGVDLFRTESLQTRDAAITAVVTGHLEFLQGLIDVCSSSIPSDHWLQNCPRDGSASGEALTVRDVCGTLAAAGKLDMGLDDYRPTILSATVEDGKSEIAVELITRGASLEIAEKNGWLPIHHATLHNDKQTLKCILNQNAIYANARVHRWNTIYTPRPTGLFASCRWHGTPLHIACIFGHVDMVQYLLEHGASPNASATPEPDGDELVERGFAKPLSITLTVGQAYELPPELSTQRLEIARLLLDHGADPSEAHGLDWPKVWRKFVGFEYVWDRLRAVETVQPM